MASNLTATHRAWLSGCQARPTGLRRPDAYTRCYAPGRGGRSVGRGWGEGGQGGGRRTGVSPLGQTTMGLIAAARHATPPHAAARRRTTYASPQALASKQGPRQGCRPATRPLMQCAAPEERDRHLCGARAGADGGALRVNGRQRLQAALHVLHEVGGLPGQLVRGQGGATGRICGGPLRRGRRRRLLRQRGRGQGAAALRQLLLKAAGGHEVAGAQAWPLLALLRGGLCVNRRREWARATARALLGRRRA